MPKLTPVPHADDPAASDVVARASAMACRDNPRVRRWLQALLQFGERAVSNNVPRGDNPEDMTTKARAG
jgi:hypothetical protein